MALRRVNEHVREMTDLMIANKADQDADARAVRDAFHGRFSVLGLVRRLLPAPRPSSQATAWRERESRADGIDCAICAHHARFPTMPLLPHRSGVIARGWTSGNQMAPGPVEMHG